MAEAAVARSTDPNVRCVAGSMVIGQTAEIGTMTDFQTRLGCTAPRP